MNFVRLASEASQTTIEVCERSELALWKQARLVPRSELENFSSFAERSEPEIVDCCERSELENFEVCRANRARKLLRFASEAS